MRKHFRKFAVALASGASLVAANAQAAIDTTAIEATLTGDGVTAVTAVAAAAIGVVVVVKVFRMIRGAM